MKKKVVRPLAFKVFFSSFFCVLLVLITCGMFVTLPFWVEKGLLVGQIIGTSVFAFFTVYSLISLLRCRIVFLEKHLYVPCGSIFLIESSKQHEVKILYSKICGVAFVSDFRDSKGAIIARHNGPSGATPRFQYLKITLDDMGMERLSVGCFTVKQKLFLLMEIQKRARIYGREIDINNAKKELKLLPKSGYDHKNFNK